MAENLAWDAEWNELTSTAALAIDNDRDELEKVMGVATGCLVNAKAHMVNYSVDNEPTAARIALGLNLKARYQAALARIAPPVSGNFNRQLAGMLLNEVVGEINWNGLAEHYLSKAKERRRESQLPD